MIVLFVLGARSEWGYIRPVYEELSKRGHTPCIWACNMATSYSYGDLSRKLTEEGYDVVFSAETSLDSGTPQASVKGMANVMTEASSWLSANRVDWVVVSGDRPEQLAFAITASFLYLPVGHIQAGEKSGNIDDLSRNAIARFAHLHFASNQDATDRLLRSGEQSFRVKLTGAPQLDDIQRDQSWIETGSRDLKLMDEDGEFVLAVFHPATEERGQDENQLTHTISSLEDERVVWIAPNNDPSSSRFLDIIRKSLKPKDKLFTNLPRHDYLWLLSRCIFMIGNSSSGILEAPSFGKPVINVGRRQNGRIRAGNIIDVAGSQDEIEMAIKKVKSNEFVQIASQVQNPYGDGNSASRVADLLEKVKPDRDFLIKELEY